MRRTFAQVLENGKIDIRLEYNRLYSILYTPTFGRDRKSLHNLIAGYFGRYHFRGTCLTLDEFDRIHGYCFVDDPKDIDIDYLVSLCEYIQNMLMSLRSNYDYRDPTICNVNFQFIFEQIRRVVDLIGYTDTVVDGLIIFIEKNPAAIAVSESERIPKELSYTILEYNHHSLKGNIEKKKQIILQLAQKLEAKSDELKNISSRLRSNMFYIFNNMNIRHNNTDPSDSSNYKNFVAELDNQQLEYWYDETYQMCLLAFLELENVQRMESIEELKHRIISG